MRVPCMRRRFFIYLFEHFSISSLLAVAVVADPCSAHRYKTLIFSFAQSDYTIDTKTAKLKCSLAIRTPNAAAHNVKQWWHKSSVTAAVAAMVLNGTVVLVCVALNSVGLNSTERKVLW